MTDESDSTTRGVWMWSVPIYNEESEKNIIFLDFEGFSADESSDSKLYDSKMFALAVLLSSHLIVNSMHVIDEKTLRQMHMIQDLPNRVKVTQSNPAVLNSTVAPFDRNGDFSRYQTPLHLLTPRLLWVLRDFSIELVTQDGTVKENEYLESTLA